MKSLDISGFFVKCTILIVVFEISVVCTFAQKTDFGGGFTFGNTISAMSAENIQGFWKTGLTTGLFGHVKVVDKYKVRMLLQMDMNFTMKGTRTKPNFGAEGHYRRDKYSLSFGYIEFPLLVRLRFNSPKTSNDGLWLDIGPSVGFLLYQRTVQIITTHGGRGGMRYEWDDLYDLKRLEFALHGGITYVFKRHHGISFRFCHSILPIGTPDYEYTSGLLKKHYNSTFHFVYSFQL